MQSDSRNKFSWSLLHMFLGLMVFSLEFREEDWVFDHSPWMNTTPASQQTVCLRNTVSADGVTSVMSKQTKEKVTAEWNGTLYDTDNSSAWKERRRWRRRMQVRYTLHLSVCILLSCWLNVSVWLCVYMHTMLFGCLYYWYDMEDLLYPVSCLLGLRCACVIKLMSH